MPFADYKDHDDCVSKNRDKADPDAYCATIERKVKEGKKVLELEAIPGTERVYVVKSEIGEGDIVYLYPDGVVTDGSFRVEGT